MMQNDDTTEKKDPSSEAGPKESPNEAFCLTGAKTVLRPLSGNDIDDRVYWNTVITDWKKTDDPEYTGAQFDEISYRKKKREEIAKRKKWRHGVYVSLEIHTRNGRHIGFINCYPFPYAAQDLSSAAIGIEIPDPDFRAQGNGTDALRVYSDYLFGAGTKAIYVITQESNAPMISASLKNGFSVCRCGGSEHPGRITLKKEKEQVKL